MPVNIPITAAGARRIRVSVGPERFVFRSYYVTGQERHWLLDIFDGQGRPLISGVNLVPGVDNLLKGHGNVLDGHALHVLAKSGTEKNLDAPGKSLTLLWFTPGEKNPYESGDPLETVGEQLWSWPTP